jgi:hypothetical protein
MYVERQQSAPGTYDFSIGDFTIDGLWHTLDLSAIVPAGASGVYLHIKSACTTVTTETLYLRQTGSAQSIATCRIRPQVNGLAITFTPVVGVDSTRRIDYKALTGSWSDLRLTVAGWWILQ